MFGLEILDVVIGLTFVYLLLSLLATALNEYVTAVMNLRGKELARGLGRLLDDLDEKNAIQRAFDGVGTRLTSETDQLTERLYNHRLIRPLATRQGWIARDWPYFWRRSREPRLPSYIPARTFALALLDVLGVHLPEATVPVPAAADDNPPASGAPVSGARNAQPDRKAPVRDSAAIRAELARVLEILKRESPHDVQQAFVGLEGLLGSASLSPTEKLRVLNVLTGAQTQLQNLHDSVEVWFNNSMDRVSGAYKRNVQGILLLLGIAIASCANADTIDMWRRLAGNDELRAAMARRAAATVEQLRPVMAPDTTDADTTPSPGSTQPAGTSGTPANPPAANPPATTSDTAKGDTSAVSRARANYLAERMRLDSMELKLGWTKEEAVRVGLLRKDGKAANARPAQRTAQPAVAGDTAQAKETWIPAGYHVDLFPFDTRPGLLKLLGILMTGIAVSLGAPFWFDLLNKVISIRAAGRAPDERPKSPEGGPKRPAERAPK